MRTVVVLYSAMRLSAEPANVHMHSDLFESPPLSRLVDLAASKSSRVVSVPSRRRILG